jgi:hypothetical protein
MDYAGRWMASVTQDEFARLQPMANEGRSIDLDGHLATLGFSGSFSATPPKHRFVVYLDFGLPPRHGAVDPTTADLIRQMVRSGGFFKAS